MAPMAAKWRNHKGLWFGRDSSLWMLPSMNDNLLDHFNGRGVSTIPALLDLSREDLHRLLQPSAASELYQDLQRFPRVDVKFKLQSEEKAQSKPPTLNIRLQLKNSRRSASRAFAPRFPKAKQAWWLVLGNTTSSELYGLKRISFTDRVVNTRMELPQMFNIQETKLILVSDCY